MAKTIDLKVVINTDGSIKKVTQSLGKLNKEAEKTVTTGKRVNQTANKLKRNLEGVAQRAGSTAKDFSRMQQGMGGLVQVYATIAANVFALSSAFLVLRKAADLSSMIKSAEDFSNRFGVNVVRITKRMQEASGGALDFAEALPSINKAVSAGVGVEQMEQLTIAATKASQTFGGSATEALNRFISASQRGRVEIIQTLGVVIKTEQAYKEYAATIGKTALELSAYDRQQAILTATIEASNRVFAGVRIDPNPFTQLGNTMVDLKDTMLTTVTDAITPFIDGFNKSKDAALALITVLVAIVGKKLFPQLSAGLVGFARAGRESTLKARELAARASRAASKAEAEAEKTRGGTSVRNIKKQEKEFRKSLGNRIAAHKSFTKSIFNQENKLNVKILTAQRAALAREISARAAGKGQQTIFKGIETTEIKRMLNAYNQLGLSIKNANIAQVKLAESSKATSNIIVANAKKMRAAYAGFRATIAQSGSALRSGFAQGFQIAEGKVVKSIRGMRIAWAIFVRDIATGTAKSGSHLANFSRAAGRTVGILAGGFSKLLSVGTSALLIYSLLNFAWETYGDTIKGISKEQRELLDSLEDLGESFKEVTKSSKKFISNMHLGEETLSNFISQAEFLRGSFDSMTVAVNDFNAALFNATGIRTIEDLSSYFGGAEKTLANLKADIKKAEQEALKSRVTVDDRGIGVAREFLPKSEDLKETEEITKRLGINIDNFRRSLEKAAEISLTPIVTNLASTIKLLNETGLGGLNDVLTGGVVANFSKLENHGRALTDIFRRGDYIGLIAAIGAIEDVGERSAAIKALADASALVAVEGKAITGNFVASGRALEETNRNMGTYLSGLEKARAASVPNKTVFNLLLDTQRALTDLDKAAQKGTKKKLEDLIGAPDLETLRQFIDIDKDIDFDEALKRVTKELKIYDAVILDSINNTGLFKIIANETFKLKNEEISTDTRKVQIIRELEKLEIRRATLSKNTAQHQLNIARVEKERLIRIKETNTLAFTEAVAIEARLKAEVAGHQAVIDAVNQRKNAEREVADQIKKGLVALQSTNNVLKQILTVENKLASNRQQALAINTRLIKLQKVELKLKKDLILQEISTFDINKITKEQDANRLMVLQAQLQLIEAQNRELERRALINKANAIEQDPDRFFSEESIKNMADIFNNKLAEGINKLKPFMQTLGEGFVSTINGGVDAAIDKLFEGHGFSGFKDAVVEALKAGLRETFAEAFKAEIMKGIGALFNLKTQEQEQKDRHNTLMVKMDEWIVAIKANTEANGGGAVGPLASTAGSAIDQVLPGLGGVLGPTISGISSGGSKDSPTATDVKNNGKEQVMTTEAVLEGAEGAINTGEGIMSILWTMITTLVTGFTSMIAASFSPLGTGGVIKGGLSKVTPMATGGIATGPNLALIGEGSNNEAVVPLPNNREIPVDLQGAGGDTINIEQNFDFSNADSSAIPLLRQEARAIEERTFNRVFSEINKGGRYAKIVGRR